MVRKDTSVAVLKCCYIFHLFLPSCSYSSVEFIHGASSDAMHTVCDSLRSVDRHCCPYDHFSINRTTQAYSPVIGPNVALAQPVFPWWQEATCWVLLEVSSEPMNLVAVSSSRISPRKSQSSPPSLLHSAPIHTEWASNISFQNNIPFSATLQSDQGYSSIDKANIFAHHLLMCSAQARID